VGLRKGQKELVERYRGGKCAIAAIPEEEKPIVCLCGRWR